MTITLENRHLRARIDSGTGALVYLSSAQSRRNLIARGGVRYGMGQNVIVGEGIWPDEQQQFEVVGVTDRSGAGVVESELRSDVLTVHRRYTLAPDSPLLAVTCTVRGRADLAEPVKIVAAFPQIDFAPDFVDSFEDEQDLYFPGLEMDGGMQTPPWHVFFRKGHREGLILAARSRRRMAQVAILANAFRGTPHSYKNYTSDPVSMMTVDRDTCMDVSLEFGPWRKDDHARILRAGRLEEPVKVDVPPAKGTRMKRGRGTIIPAIKIAPASAVTTKFHTRKWQVVRTPWTLNAKVLFAGTGVDTPPIRFKPTQRGLHRVFVGVGNGSGITCRAAGEPYPTMRWRFDIDRDSGVESTFRERLAGRQRGHEIEVGVFDLNGKPLEFNRFGNRLLPCCLDYIRLEKLSASAAATWRKQESLKPFIPLSGLNDVPDIAFFDDPQKPDPDIYRANVWEHARSGVNRIYWRIDGQCSDFPSRHNTMRYVSAKVHGVFYPGAKAYGKALRKVNMLKLAVEEAHKHNLELYGWMRFNNYSGNVQSDFYKQNPQWRERRENGKEASKLCLAFPEVREHKLSILLEAAEYGVDGVNLGFLRHPPVFMYHPVMVEGYKTRYGELPPMVADQSDPTFLNRLAPDDAASVRWFQYRADFLTQFGRDLKRRLRDMGKQHVKVALWVRPNHCLFDGIDMPAWLNEGLCDEVVVNGMIGPERVYSKGNGKEYDPVVCGVRPEWKQMIQSKVPIIRCLTHLPLKWWKQHLPAVFAEGYDGLCTYESDWSVINPEFVKFYRSLRQSRM